jgi:hypothetical protein
MVFSGTVHTRRHCRGHFAMLTTMLPTIFSRINMLILEDIVADIATMSSTFNTLILMNLRRQNIVADNVRNIAVYF